MAQHITSSFQTADKLKIHTEAWLPDGEMKAVVLLSHGIAEHTGRYKHVGEYFAAHGYAMYGLDHRTHGQSGGEPRVYITDFNQVVEDLKQYFDSIPHQRIFIYGHSMGSFIATLFTLRYQDRLAGFISSGAPLTLDTQFPKIVATIGNVISALAPTLPLIPLELSTISRDPAVVAAYNADPLVFAGKVRARMAAGYNNALAPAREQLPTLRLPILVMHGGDDKIAPPSGSQLLYEKASSADKTLKIYPGLYHELHNEPEKQRILADIVAWLDAH
jgi:acylglycerol lipase